MGAIEAEAAEAAGTETARPGGDEGGPLAATLRLAGPVVLAELGWMAMSLVDTLMVAPLGPAAIGAVGLGSSIHSAFAVVGMGMLLGLDAVVSRAYGEGKVEECHRWLVQGVILALALAGPAMLGLLLVLPALPRWGVDPEVLELVDPFLRVGNWSTPPLLIYAAFRRHTQAMGRVRPLMVALLAANLCNAAGNAVFVHGLLGFPALGAVGTAYATVGSRAAMAATLVGFTFAHDARHRTGLLRLVRQARPEPARLRRLLTLGTPAAGQLGLEVGVFALASALAATFEPEALAAHQIVLNMAALAFMVPLGVSAAGAVRVGQALGRRDPEGAGRAGWAALALGTGFMTGPGLLFLVLPRTLVGLFSTDPAVLATGAALMLVAAAFQLFDGLQVVATGVLRGTGDTRTPLLGNAVAHWLVGLPVGYGLGVVGGRGVVGLWVGLSTGLILAGAILLVVWAARTRRLAEIAARPITPH